MANIRYQHAHRPWEVRDDVWTLEMTEFKDLVIHGTESDMIRFFTRYPLCAQHINSEIQTNYRDVIRVSPLSYVADQGRLDLAKLLVDRYKADVNFPPDAYRRVDDRIIFIEQSPLSVAACDLLDFDMSNYLLDRGAHMNTYVMRAVIGNALERANGEDDAQDQVSKNLCEWLQKCFLRYPRLKTNECVMGDGKEMYWFQDIMNTVAFNGIHRFIALFFSLEMLPQPNIYLKPPLPLLEDLLTLDEEENEIGEWTVKQMDSYLEAAYLLYVRLPEDDPESDAYFRRCVFMLYPYIQEASRTRFSLLNGGLPCTPENIIATWWEDRHDHSTFQQTLLIFYSVRMVPRIGQLSPVRILPTDILLRLSEMLGHGRLKLPREMDIPSVFLSAM